MSWGSTKVLILQILLPLSNYITSWTTYFLKTKESCLKTHVLCFVATGSYVRENSWIRNHPTLLVHSSLRGDAAESWSSSGLLSFPNVWLHTISGRTLRSFTSLVDTLTLNLTFSWNWFVLPMIVDIYFHSDFTFCRQHAITEQL